MSEMKPWAFELEGYVWESEPVQSANGIAQSAKFALWIALRKSLS
ncbi:hypothetical protein [Adlercreutzia sp. ZJ473]|nr:hypothetical protein [Adlercreutzia sp. ZJ473]